MWRHDTTPRAEPARGALPVSVRPGVLPQWNSRVDARPQAARTKTSLGPSPRFPLGRILGTWPTRHEVLYGCCDSSLTIFQFDSEQIAFEHNFPIADDSS